ncbi:hypothetical protein BP5796_07075 [Coleophoma crateriformis]|uniref:Mercuric reductase n=1 Tax=Coleophoma crateriformis TaxID=565419 RepID=A0A3D8RHW5_9HELO|nr:hypothetical protein BP5796_07075 [Coleophoma crateriformis]
MARPAIYDSIIVGSGQAGTPLASACAKAGRTVLLIERTHVGGCCINEGCTPTKTMVASGRAAYLARRGADYGVHTPGGEDGRIKIDMLKVRSRKREIVKSFGEGSEKRVKAAGVDVWMGEAAFVDGKTLRVRMHDGSEKTVTSEQIFLNVGERPAPPMLDGLEEVAAERILDSTSIQELDVVPAHLVVLGGGYVGVEFAQLFRRLGAEVTIVQRGKQLLPREDKEIADALLEILKEDGVSVILEGTTTRVSSKSPDSCTLTVENSNTEHSPELEIEASHMLFAAGRIPNTESLNLSAAGIKTNAKGYIITNEYLETSNPGVWALGDVKGPPAFTHISYDDFRIVQRNLLEHKNPGSKSLKKASIKTRQLPYVVYTDPQLGHIGLHEAEARKAYPDATIKTATMPMSYVARALETDESRGMMKAVVDGNTGMILGFTCLGIEGGEVMAVVQTAMLGNLRYEVLQEAIWAHPSLAESLNNLWGFLK